MPRLFPAPFSRYLSLRGALLLLCAGFLAACAPAATQTRFEPPPRPGGRLCAIQCAEAKDHCNDQCNLTARSCVNDMQAQAIKDYDAYSREQFKTHQPIELLPREFERPEKCKPVGCLESCEISYRACYERCGGRVITESSCRAFCF